jgi:hypothetical protein
MADLNKIISVDVQDNASADLKKIDQGLTKVTQSTKNLSKETKTHTQAVVENGGAMGILNDLTGGLAMTFKDASEAIGLAGVSLKSFRGVLLATGIGALVLAVGYLAENWEKVAGAITGAARAQEDYNVAIAKTEETRRNIANITNKEIANLEYEKELLISQGASKEKIAAIDKRIFDARVKQNNINLQTYKEELILQNDIVDKDTKRNAIIAEGNQLKKDLLQANNDLAKQEVGSLGEQTFKRVIERLNLEIAANKRKLEVYDSTNENIKKRADAQDKYNAAEINSVTLLTQRQKDLNSEIDKTPKKKKPLEPSQALIDFRRQLSLFTSAAKEANDAINALAPTEFAVLDPTSGLPEIVDTALARADKLQFAIEEESLWYDQRLGLFDEFNKRILESTTLSEQQKDAILYESKMRQIEIEQEKWDFITNAAANASTDILNIVTVFYKDQKKASKGFAIATVIIEQARAVGMAINNLVAANAKAVAASPLTSGQPWVGINTASTLLGIAGGIASAVKSIQAINSETLTSAGGSGVGAGPQAQFNIVSSSGTNQLAATIAAQQNQPVNAYVVGTDVSTQQALDRNRITNATFL